MRIITCTSCSEFNGPDEEVCFKCGSPLTEAKLLHSIEELKKTTEKMQALMNPPKTFSSFNGFGTTLLDYRALPDGTYEAMRWVIVMALPVVPLSSYIIQPTEQEFRYGRETSRFKILDKKPLSLARILRTYLLVVAGLLPIILGFIYSSAVNRTLGGPLAFFAMIAAIVWAGYIILYRVKNDSKAYKKAA